MNKHELAARLARRVHQSRGYAADRLDALIYKLWKESRYLKHQLDNKDEEETSTAPEKKP